VPDDGLPHLGATRDNVDDTRRNTRLDTQLSQAQSRQRSLFGGLQDNRIPSNEGGRELPRRDHQGEVPWCDQAADAERFATTAVVDARNRERDGNTVQLCCPAGVVAKVLNGIGHGDSAADPERLTLVPSLQPSQLFGMLFDQIGNSPQQSSPCGGHHSSPIRRLKSLGSRGDGGFDICRCALWHEGEHFARGRVDRLERSPARRLGPFPINQHLRGHAASSRSQVPRLVPAHRSTTVYRIRRIEPSCLTVRPITMELVDQISDVNASATSRAICPGDTDPPQRDIPERR
jgi:hypothetical protein